MDLAAERHGDMLLVRVAEPRIDAAIAIQFKEAMRELVAGGPPRVVLDLAPVGFLDSSGLGAVVAVMKALGPGRHLELAALSPSVARVFRLTRMDSIFTIHETIHDAAPGAGGRDKTLDGARTCAADAPESAGHEA